MIYIKKKDKVRISDNPDPYHSKAVSRFAGCVVTVRSVSSDLKIFDNSEGVIFNQKDIVEVCERVFDTPNLSPGDEVVLTSDITKVKGLWSISLSGSLAHNYMDWLLGEKVIVTQVSRTFRAFHKEEGMLNWTFSLSDIKEVIPRPDGTIPNIPDIYKEGEKVVLIDESPDGSLPSGWNSRMRRFLGTVVTIENISDTHFSIVREQDPNGNFTFNIGDIIRRATKEDIENQIKREIARLEEQKKLRKTMVCEPEKIKEIATSVFGEDRVMLTKINNSSFKISIHFPEINITNSRGDTHTIKDIFVLFAVDIGELTEDFKCSINLFGARTTFSEKELLSGYTHSHLPTRIAFPNNNWGEFCLGTSDYRLAIEGARMELQEENWFMLFLGLKNYLSWESLEGGPYICIYDIKIDGSGMYNRYTDKELEDNIINKIVPRLPISCWQFDGKSLILDAYNYEIIDIFNKYSSIRSMNKNSEEVAYQVKRCRGPFNSLSYKFNDKDFSFRVEKEENNEENTISTELIQKSCNLIEKMLDKFNKNYQYELLKHSKSFITEARVL